MKGVLTFISSTNPPVFGYGPLDIEFTVRPRVGEPFLFTSKKFGFCNTSDVRIAAIDSEIGDYLLTTRNSLYRLEVKRESDKSESNAPSNEEGIGSGN